MTRTARGAQLEVARIQSEINRLFETLLRLREGEEQVGSWVPAVDCNETEDMLVVEAEVPGVDPESLVVEAESGTLYLRGTRRPPAAREAPQNQVLQDEREYGAFERVIPLITPVNTRNATCRLVDGVLRVEFPRVPNRRGEPVPIPIARG